MKHYINLLTLKQIQRLISFRTFHGKIIITINFINKESKMPQFFAVSWIQHGNMDSYLAAVYNL